MQDINQWWSSDIVSESGGISLSDSVTTTQQRIIRRVLTNPVSVEGPPDYIWNPTYGCGAKRYVGAPQNKLIELKNIIVNQLSFEDGVSQSPLPEVILNTSSSLLTITIKYVDISTGLPQTLSFDTGGV